MHAQKEAIADGYRLIADVLDISLTQRLSTTSRSAIGCF
jgi:hypothetical protein